MLGAPHGCQRVVHRGVSPFPVAVVTEGRVVQPKEGPGCHDIVSAVFLEHLQGRAGQRAVLYLVQEDQGPVGVEFDFRVERAESADERVHIEVAGLEDAAYVPVRGQVSVEARIVVLLCEVLQDVCLPCPASTFEDERHMGAVLPFHKVIVDLPLEHAYRIGVEVYSIFYMKKSI